MNIQLVNLKKQYSSIKSEIDSAISQILDNTAFIKGKAVLDFEEGFARLQKVKHCIGVGNGTDALIIALKTLGIGCGDEVIVPANSFIASSEAVTAVGAKVVFVDNLPDYYTIDTSKIEEKISKKTKAIIAVHLYGQPADMDSIMIIAQKHKLLIIEDSAQAHLAEYKGKKVGNFGPIATFSFYPGKNLGAYGDGGAIVTNNDELAEKARMYANHGRISKYNHEFEGYNSRLDGIQAAVLNVKLNYIENWTEKRRHIASCYIRNLRGCENIVLPAVNPDTNPVWHLFVIRADNREVLREYLRDKGIASGVHYPIALPNLQAYKYLNYSREDFPLASLYQDKIVSLPIYPELTDDEVDYISNQVKTFYK